MFLNVSGQWKDRRCGKISVVFGTVYNGSAGEIDKSKRIAGNTNVHEPTSNSFSFARVWAGNL